MTVIIVLILSLFLLIFLRKVLIGAAAFGLAVAIFRFVQTPSPTPTANASSQVTVQQPTQATDQPTARTLDEPFSGDNSISSIPLDPDSHLSYLSENKDEFIHECVGQGENGASECADLYEERKYAGK